VLHLILNFLAQEKQYVLQRIQQEATFLGVQGTAKHEVRGKSKWIVFCSNLKRENGVINANT